jgi:protein gp37
LLESIDLNPDVYRLLDWLIIGGESGPHARPCNVDWIRSLVDQGAKLGVATFVKQLGTKPLNYSSPIPLLPQKDKKGGDFDKFPDELKVRQYPIGL